MDEPTIPITDPGAAYRALQGELDTAIRTVLEGGSYILGDLVDRFEKEFADHIGVGSGVGVNNGTDAIHLGLRALGIGPGDEVITVSHTAVATVAAIRMAGAIPVLADVDPHTRTIDPGSAALLISPRTKAMLVVHLYGHPADLEALGRLCMEHGLALIEDCAQAHGAMWNGKMVGSFGNLAAFSFYPTKNLGAIGDAGMVVTNDPELAEKVRLLRQYGWSEPQNSSIEGWNSRLDPIQAAVLSVKLRHLAEYTLRRRELAQRYREQLRDLEVVLPEERKDCTHVYHLYVIEMQDRLTRDRLRNHLRDRRIMTGIHYPHCVHEQPAYGGWVRTAGLPVSERLSGTVLSLPMYPELTDQEQQRVIHAIRVFFNKDR